MVKLALLLALAGCYEDLYRCTVDAQCDVDGGRCEPDGFCSGFDTSCPTNRRYQDHAGALSNTCLDDSVVPLNACAGGQPAAKREGCFTAVCERLPMCCDIAWTDACAQLAQQECDVQCDTRIAVSATRQMTTELWDVRWLGDRFEIVPVTDLTAPLQWVAPAPGELEPRRVGIAANQLLVGDLAFDIDPARIYVSVATMPLARDGHDTIAVTSQLGTDITLEIFEPAIEEHRTFVSPGTQLMTLGDIDHKDSFIDVVLRKAGNNAQYSYLLNLDSEDHLRQLSDKAFVSMAGGLVQGQVVHLRQLDWLDFDGDRLVDLVGFGAEVTIHRDPNGLRAVPEDHIDCDPPTALGCATTPAPNTRAATFAGAALPDPDRPSVVFSLFPGRKLFRASLAGAIEIQPLAFPGDSCTCPATCDQDTCPGNQCTCTYDCSACVPVHSIIARDLDGDHRTDLIAIDAHLQLYTALAPDFTWSAPVQIPTAFTSVLINNILTSTSGAPR